MDRSDYLAKTDGNVTIDGKPKLGLLAKLKNVFASVRYSFFGETPPLGNINDVDGNDEVSMEIEAPHPETFSIQSTLREAPKYKPSERNTKLRKKSKALNQETYYEPSPGAKLVNGFLNDRSVVEFKDGSKAAMLNKDIEKHLSEGTFYQHFNGMEVGGALIQPKNISDLEQAKYYAPSPDAKFVNGLLNDRSVVEFKDGSKAAMLNKDIRKHLSEGTFYQHFNGIEMGDKPFKPKDVSEFNKTNDDYLNSASQLDSASSTYVNPNLKDKISSMREKMHGPKPEVVSRNKHTLNF
ncbi:hypothetical protein [Paraburkholderia tropica]|uniref:hypothetical protein n=1 Tax=Paraburkholderia tropica TaxID=92647 RepID=UPI003D29F179